MRIVASMVLKTAPMLWVSRSRKARLTSVEVLERGQLDDRLGLPLEEHGQHDDAHLPGLAEAGGDGDEIRRHVGEEDALFFHRALADQALAEADVLGEPLVPSLRVAGEQLERGRRRCCR